MGSVPPLAQLNPTVRRLLIALSLAASLALASCAAEPTTSPTHTEPPPTPTPGVGVIVDHLDAPWSVAFHDGATLVSERDTARVLELDEAGEVRQVAVIDDVQPSGEGGLLGIAVRDGYLYTYFTAREGNRIERFELLGGPGELSLGGPERILDGIPSALFHNGGRIAFGPGGMLYATTGDAGDRPSAQDLDSLGGKILRMTPEGDVPADNPFPGSYVYSYGHRNSQGIGWTDDGLMYATEFGQDTWDELNLIEAGNNYGWPEVEGIAGEVGYVDPLQQWAPADASPSGLAIVDGSIWIANLRGERLREVPLGDLTSSVEHWVGEHGRLRDVTVAPDGTLWVVTNNTDGRGDPGPSDDRILTFDPLT